MIRVSAVPAGFVVVDTESMATEYVDNGASQVMAQGAGIQTAERLSSLGVGAVLSGYVGPKAFTTLQAAGMQVIRNWMAAAWAKPCVAIPKVPSVRPRRRRQRQNLPRL